MGLLNDLWWLSGFVLAAPIAVVAMEFFNGGDTPMALAFLALAGIALLLPEYIRWRLFGGGSVLERVPLVGGSADSE